MASALPKTGPVALSANIAEYVNTKALRAGEIASDLVKISFDGPKVANQGFKPMIREGRFHISELAMVSFLQARSVGKPLVLMPVPIMSRFQHHCISYNLEKTGGEIAPKQIEGRRVGLRSYSQTTAMWVRAILKHEYGVDLGKIKWASYDPPHPAEVSDPGFVEKYVPDERSVEQMLVDGAFDAAIIGGEIKNEPKIKTLIPDPHNQALKWYEKFGVVPVNHYLVVGAELSRERPDVIAELYRMVGESKKANPLIAGGVDLLPMGYAANRKTIEAVIMYANEQGLIDRRFDVDELFDDTTRKLGA
ncbi:MAG: phosphate ABC transporter substrate-binding protein [Hyphomicrobiaceae bacterium]